MHNSFLTKLLITVFIIISLASLSLLILNDRWSDGDEVHYLVVTSSLVKDCDLVLDNNYSNKDYFDHHGNEEEPTAFEGKNGELRPPGGILISILEIPAYKLSMLAKKIFKFDSSGYFLFFPRLTIFLFHIIFSVVLINYLIASGFNKNTSLFCVILYLIQLPILLYGAAIFTDLLSGYFLMTGVSGIYLYTIKRRYFWLAMSSIFFGLCIFLHSKCIALTSGLVLSSLLYIFHKHEFRIKKMRSWYESNSGNFWKIIFAFIGPWTFFLITSMIVKIYWYGQVSFDGVGNRGIGIFLGNPLQGWLGQWLDIEVGLIPNAPLFALIIVGVFIWFRKNKTSFFLLIPVISIYLIFNAGYREWHAGFCPPARYLMIVIPLLLPSIAHTLEISKKVIWLRWLIGVLALLSLLLSSLVNFVGRRGLPYFKGYNIYWNTILKYFGVEPTESFSVLNFFNPTFFDYLVGIIIFLALLSLGYYLQRKISTRPSNTDNN